MTFIAASPATLGTRLPLHMAVLDPIFECGCDLQRGTAMVKVTIRGHAVRCARAVRKVGCFPPLVATGPRVLDSAPPMLF